MCNGAMIGSQNIFIISPKKDGIYQQQFSGLIFTQEFLGGCTQDHDIDRACIKGNKLLVQKVARIRDKEPPD